MRIRIDEKVTNMKLNRNRTRWHKCDLKEWLGGDHKYLYEYHIRDFDGKRYVGTTCDTEYIEEVVFVFDYETGENVGIRIERRRRPKGSPKVTGRVRHEGEIKELLQAIKRFEYVGFRLGFLTFDMDSSDCFFSLGAVKALEEEKERAEKADWITEWRLANADS